MVSPDIHSLSCHHTFSTVILIHSYDISRESQSTFFYHLLSHSTILSQYCYIQTISFKHIITFSVLFWHFIYFSLHSFLSSVFVISVLYYIISTSTCLMLWKSVFFYKSCSYTLLNSMISPLHATCYMLCFIHCISVFSLNPSYLPPGSHSPSFSTLYCFRHYFIVHLHLTFCYTSCQMYS